MNPKRIIISLVVAFLAISATDYLIHHVWLEKTYALDLGKLWRTEKDMETHFAGIFIGEFLVAIAFSMLWARIALGGAGIGCALGLGLFLGLFYSGGAVMQNAVQPLPEGLLMKWIVGGMLQAIFVSLLLFVVNKPVKSCPPIGRD